MEPESEELLEAVAEALRASGVNAGVQDTGGDTLCVVIAEADGSLDEPKFWFGTAGEEWAAQVDGDRSGVWTDVPSDEVDPAKIAAGILGALKEYRKKPVG